MLIRSPKSVRPLLGTVGRVAAATAILAVLAAPGMVAAPAPVDAQVGAPFTPPVPPKRLTPEEIAEARAQAAAEAAAERRAEEAQELALLHGLPLGAEEQPASATTAASGATEAASELETLEPAAAPRPTDVADAGRTLRALPIGALRRSSNGLTLNGRQGRLDLSLPVAEGTEIDAVTMRLMWRSSAELAADRSRMWLYLNGEPLAELPMGAAGDEMTADVDLPTGAIDPGANRLSFVAHQEHVAGCEAEDLARLWTQIDATNSYLVVEGTAGETQMTLAAFDDPAGPLGASSLPVRIAVADMAGDPASLRVGGLVAAGLALRGDDRPLRVEPMALEAIGSRTATGPLAASDGPIVTVGAVTVVAGTVDQLRPILGEDVLAGVDGPWLARRDALADNGGAVLVVTGRSMDEVATAARALANPAWSLPETESARVSDVPPAPRMAMAPTVAPASTVRFGDLDMSVRNAEGSADRTEVRFDLPPDVFVADNRRARIRLSFAYGDGLSSDSLLNVVVNGAYVGAIPLTSGDGDLVERMPITFPAHHLRPGRNVVTVEPVTGTADSLGCAWRPIDTARVDVFPDSEIELPEMARAARLPDLGLAATTGYPFVRGNGQLARLIPASGDADTVSALWTLVARITQVSGTAAIAETVGQARPDLPGDVVLIGRGAALDRNWLSGAPAEVRSVLSRTAGGVRNAPSIPGAPAPLAPPSLDDGAPAAGVQDPGTRPLRAAVVDPEMLGEVTAQVLPALMAAGDAVERGFDMAAFWRQEDARLRAGAPTHDAWLAAFPRPDGSGTVTVLAAEGGPQLRRAAHEVVAPEMWDRLSGDFATWRVGAGGLSTATVAPPLFVADDLSGWNQRVLFVNSLLAERPGLWFLISLSVLVGFGAITSAALGWRDRRADG